MGFLIHNNPAITTVASLIKSVAIFSELTAEQLVKSTTEGISNYQRMQRRYSAKELRENDQFYSSASYGSILIKVGTTLYLANETLKREVLYKEQPNVIQITETKPFISDALNKLMRDPKYIRSSVLKNNRGTVTTVHNDVTVYMWLRSLTALGEDSVGAWVDVTPFIEVVSTSKGSDAGSFTLSIGPVRGVVDDERGMVFESESLRGYLSDYVATNHIHYPQKGGDGLNRNHFFFEHAIQKNDLVYIRFERLETDRVNKALQFNISPSDVVNTTWDMIGLVDGVEQTVDSSSTIAIGVGGRDLTKMLIDDGSYFFPEQFAGQIFNKTGILADRNKVQSSLTVLNAYTFKTVETGLKFIWNKFSSLGLVPDSAFSGYGDRAVKAKFSLQQTIAQKTGQTDVIALVDPFLKENRKGVWQIFDLIFDKESARRVLADNSVSQEQGSIINSIRKFCQEPFVEFFTDTYNDRFVAIIRKPPYDAKGYKGMVYDDVTTEGSGSIEDFVRGEGYEITPNSRLSDLVIDIDESDVLTEAFTYHDEAYSWYQISPQGLIRGGNETLALAFMPLIAFDEYAEIYGSRPLSIVSNYIPYEYIDDSARDKRQNFAEAQAYMDLQYLIQSSQYLPFARKGSVTLAAGNRMLKKGLFVRYKPTNEIFHIDQVSHGFSISGSSNDRVTTVSLSRGLREPFIKGVEIDFGNGNTKTVSYFNIINTEIGENPSINNNEFLKNWKVDKDVFNFFLHRKQSDKKYDR